MAISDRDYYRMFGVDIDEIRKCENDNYFKGVKDSREWYKQKLEQIRAEIESRLQGVNITLEILVKDDALIPRMEAAKTTLEEVLDIMDKAIKELN